MIWHGPLGLTNFTRTKPCHHLDRQLSPRSTVLSSLVETTMETPIDTPDVPSSSAPGPVEATGPIRILVQTETHLVPGDLYPEKIELMRNIICQHHWNRDYDRHRDRCYVHGGEFGYSHRVCYFLVDSGSTLSATENPPILWYRWMGDSLLEIPLRVC